MNSTKLKDIKLTYSNLLHLYTLTMNYQKEKFKSHIYKSSLVVRIPGFHCHDSGSISGQGTGIP